MASITASTGVFALTSRRDTSNQWGNWSEASQTVTLTFSTPIPANSRVTSSVLTVHVTQDPIVGSYMTVDGQQVLTSIGDKAITISLTPGTSSRAVTVTFKGNGTTYSTSQVQLSLSLAASYELTQTKCTAPTSIQASPTAGEPGWTVALSWSGAAGGVNNSIVGYTVYRGSTAIETVSVSTSAASTEVPITGNPGETMALSVATKGGAGSAWDSDKSAAANVLVTCKAPDKVSASAQTAPAGSSLTLSWSGAMGGANAAIAGYEIYRADGTGSYTIYKTVGNVTQTEVDAPAQYGQKSAFRVKTKCENASFDSGLSAVEAVVTAGPGMMLSPTELWISAKEAPLGTYVLLAWRGAAAGDHNAIAGYAVWRATAKNGNFLQVASMAAAESQGEMLVTAPMAEGASYYYKVSTISASPGTDSGPSSVLEGVTATSGAVAMGTGRTNAVVPGPWQ